MFVRNFLFHVFLVTCILSGSIPLVTHAWQIDSGTFWRSATSDLSGSWVDTGAAFPGSIGFSHVTVIGSYIYSFGGAVNGTTPTNVIYRAPISDPTAWTNTGATLPGNLAAGQLAVIGSYIYIFGGSNSMGTVTNVIYRAPISDPTSWTNTGSTLPGNLVDSQVAIIGSYVYLFGGVIGINSVTNVIYRAPLSNPTSWTNTGATLPGSRGGSQLVVTDTYVYLFGGFNSSGDTTNVIYRAPVSDPTSWTNTGATLPLNLGYSHLAILENYVYLFGGATGLGSFTNAIYRAPVSDPTSWTNTGATLPGTSCCGQLAIVNSDAYLFGASMTSDAIYRTLLSPSNTAPSTPTISGPTTGYTDTSYTFSLSDAIDSEGDDIRYAIDWDNNSTADAYAPSSGYVSSNTSQDVGNDWASEGGKTFQVRSEDDLGAVSSWATHTITLSEPPEPPGSPATTTKVLSCSFGAPGAYDVRGIAVDSRGATSSFSVTPVTINIAPACTDCYPLMGYGWSETIGWVSLNCENTLSCGDTDYYVEANVQGVLSGYAWSEHVGWISANQSDVAGCPSGGTCTARIDSTNGNFLGWMRALGFSNPESGGWDGWISLSCLNTGACGAVSYGPILNFITDAVGGFAWGEFVTGWIDFSRVTTTFEPLLPDTYSCLDEDTLRYVASDYSITDTLCPFAAYGYGCLEQGGTAVCLTPPTPGPSGGNESNNLRALPKLVHSGGTSVVSWNIEDATSCTVNGDNGDAWTGLTGSNTSTPITERTIYTLYCESGIPGFDFTSTATVNIAPSWQEI